MAVPGEKTVLIVEDEATFAMNTSQALEAHGYGTVMVMSGEEAVEAVKARTDIGLVLMDVELGEGMDGTEAAGIILRERDIPVVFMSNYTEREVVEKTGGITSYGYVVKNSGDTVMIASVAMAFRLHDAKIREKKNEEALREGEERFRFALRDFSIVVFNQDLDLRYTWVFNPNPGFNVEEVIGKRDEDLLAPEDAAQLTAIKRKVLDEGKSIREEVWMMIQGKKHWYDLCVEPVSDVHGAVTGIRCLSIDITERRRVEGDLRLHRRIVENMAEGVMLARTDDGIIVYANANFEKMFGYGPGELVGQHVSILNAPGESSPDQVFWEIVESLHAKEIWRGEVLNRKKGGDQFWSRAHVSATDSPEFGSVWITVQEDITVRKTAELALAENEVKYKTVADFTYDWEYWMRPDGSYAYVSPSCETVTGYRQEEFIRDPSLMNRILCIEDKDLVSAHLDTMLAGTDGDTPFDFRIMHRDGSVRWIGHRCRPVYSREGAFLGRRGSHRDITDRKYAEESLRASEEKYHTLFARTTQGVVYQDRDGVIIDANPAAERILGLSLEQMRGRTSVDQRWRAVRSDGTGFPGNEHPSMEALRTGMPVLGAQMGVYHPADEEYRWLLVDAVPLFLPGESAAHSVFATFTDITDRIRHDEEVKRLTAEVMISQEKERELIARGLHDSVGQTLSAANLNIRAYQLEPKKNAERLEKGLAFIEQAIVELREVYSSMYPSVLRDLGLEAAIRWLVKNILEDGEISVDLECDPCENMGKIEAINIYRMLQEIFSNIVKHSGADAVKIEFRCDYGSRSVRIDVSDNGRGFLLKRPSVAGHGYGLSNIRQRAVQMGGNLIISSMPGRGTRITIECGTGGT